MRLKSSGHTKPTGRPDAEHNFLQYNLCSVDVGFYTKEVGVCKLLRVTVVIWVRSNELKQRSSYLSYYRVKTHLGTILFFCVFLYIQIIDEPAVCRF